MVCIQMSFCFRIPKLGIPKFPKLGLSSFWRAITSCTDLWLRWNLKKNYSPCRKLCNDMWHATWMHLFQGDSWFLVGKSQIGTLTFSLCFSHNLCFKYSNGLYKPIFHIYVSRAFQWYELFLIKSILTPEIPLWKFKSP
jgi:hypothetical protein